MKGTVVRTIQRNVDVCYVRHNLRDRVRDLWPGAKHTALIVELGTTFTYNGSTWR